MGRPVRKDVLGTEVFGTYAAASAGIKVTGYLNGSATNAYIVSQKGSRRYKITDGTYSDVARLVSTTPDAIGKMLMVGYLAIAGNNPSLESPSVAIPISKLNKRTAIGFDDTRYTWVLRNDSSVDYIELTAF